MFILVIMIVYQMVHHQWELLKYREGTVYNRRQMLMLVFRLYHPVVL